MPPQVPTRVIPVPAVIHSNRTHTPCERHNISGPSYNFEVLATNIEADASGEPCGKTDEQIIGLAAGMTQWGR